ncbi:MAG: hypothetical protein ACFFDN_46990 [Candidatus Hodarchaeota archaeon]
MSKFYRVIKGTLLTSLIVLSLVFIYYFFYFDQFYIWDSLGVKINWMVTILFFILFFYILLFMIDFKIYNLFFIFLIILGTPLWIMIYCFEFFKIALGFWNWSALRNIAAILCISILAPGLSLNFIKYIKNNSNLYEKRRLFQNYHIHEGFVGILFIIIAFCLWIIRHLMIQHEIMKKELRIFLALIMVPLFLFLFSGSFLFFRDRKDLLRLKLIERKNYEDKNNLSSVFNPITQDSIRFFKSPRIVFYPIGILISSFSVNMFIHGTYFLPEEIFSLTHETIVFIGFILCFVGGGLIGIDWYRVFAKLYPELYLEVEKILNDFKNIS